MFAPGVPLGGEREFAFRDQRATEIRQRKHCRGCAGNNVFIRSPEVSRQTKE